MFTYPNKTKAKLKQGLPVYGVISTTDDAQLPELLGLAGFDYYMLDAEHGLIDAALATNVIRACERADITPLVRIGSKDPKLVLQYLDAGIMGVMMPGLETTEEIKMLVDSIKYAPFGKRGMGLSRASGYVAYGNDAAAFIDFSNANTLVIPQFEDAALIDRLPAMMSVPGVDACIIGPRDLSLNMGFADGPYHPEVQAMIDRAIAVCKEAKVVAGITSGTRADAAQQIARGANMILVPAQMIILSGAKAILPE